jgi:hypothetical protein
MPRPRPGRKSTAKGVKRLPSSKFAYPRTREKPRVSDQHRQAGEGGARLLGTQDHVR